jgi:hypothetical protein
VEFLRINPEVAAGLSEAQIIGFLLMTLGSLLLIIPALRRVAR